MQDYWAGRIKGCYLFTKLNSLIIYFRYYVIATLLDPRYKFKCFDNYDHDRYRHWLEEEVEKEALKTSITINQVNERKKSDSDTESSNPFLSMISDEIGDQNESDIFCDVAPNFVSDLKVEIFSIDLFYPLEIIS